MGSGTLGCNRYALWSGPLALQWCQGTPPYICACIYFYSYVHIHDVCMSRPVHNQHMRGNVERSVTGCNIRSPPHSQNSRSWLWELLCKHLHAHETIMRVWALAQAILWVLTDNCALAAPQYITWLRKEPWLSTFFYSRPNFCWWQVLACETGCSTSRLCENDLVEIFFPFGCRVPQCDRYHWPCTLWTDFLLSTEN